MEKVLITGASKGIGKAIAEKFTTEGFEVVKPSSRELDLSSNDSVMSFIKKNKRVKFDTIINNAGINDLNDITDVLDRDIEKIMSINLLSPLKLIRAFAPAMKKAKYGRIVNIGSIWAVVSRPGRGVYSASKHGLHGLTNTAALELARYNILVNTLCPGFTDTELTRKNLNLKERKLICSEIPLGRMAETVEIASLAYFLGSRMNSYITGQKIVIDGGFTVK